MKVIKAPTPFKKHIYSKTSVFLAGSIDMGKAEDWQTRISRELSDLDIVILNPRRDDWDSSWKQDISDPKFSEQVNWELDALSAADLILVYFDPKGQAPITLMELGLFSDHNIMVCCPEGYWRRGNVQVVCQRKGISLFDKIEDMIAEARKQLA